MKHIVDDWWVTVAAYRPKPPPPPSCHLYREFNYCVGNTAIWSITATLPGYTVTNADYDVQLNGSSGWIDIYLGVLTCPVVNLDTGALARALLQTQYGTSECTVIIPSWDCGSEHEPF